MKYLVSIETVVEAESAIEATENVEDEIALLHLPYEYRVVDAEPND